MIPVPDPPLTDGVVFLRPPDERDLGAIERGINDPDVILWFGPPKQTAAEILELNRTRWRQGTGPTFSICEADDRCVGHAWVNLTDRRRGSVGYWLLPEARGRGLATRSVRLLAGWAFRDLGLARLALLTEPGNRASQRIAERLGFLREGVLRSYDENDGRCVDNVVFSLLPDEFEPVPDPEQGL